MYFSVTQFSTLASKLLHSFQVDKTSEGEIEMSLSCSFSGFLSGVSANECADRSSVLIAMFLDSVSVFNFFLSPVFIVFIELFIE